MCRKARGLLAVGLRGAFGLQPGTGRPPPAICVPFGAGNAAHSACRRADYSPPIATLGPVGPVGVAVAAPAVVVDSEPKE